jgi:hypothetical protein
MTIYDIPFVIHPYVHAAPFPANTKAGSRFLEFDPFRKKNLWKLMLQIELPLLWMQQLTIPTVNFLQC